jgi:hypothetical protein
VSANGDGIASSAINSVPLRLAGRWGIPAALLPGAPTAEVPDLHVWYEMRRQRDG